ncbi:hypothetical protein [Microtetraspora sp. NBRC 13810]|uniref:hypothetical protein n=1 Tax=Microtetraspora sp. NBRC 13810 TaxID=3030990 RepID=UPI0025542EA5|nr:hypothetical protein [Microtetraspora sp. NBRC 13810]
MVVVVVPVVVPVDVDVVAAVHVDAGLDVVEEVSTVVVMVVVVVPVVVAVAVPVVMVVTVAPPMAVAAAQKRLLAEDDLLDGRGRVDCDGFGVGGSLERRRETGSRHRRGDGHSQSAHTGTKPGRPFLDVRSHLIPMSFTIPGDRLD